MGCFSTCFRKSKRHRRTQKRSIRASPSLLDQLEKYESVDDFKVSQLIKEEEEEEKVENPSDPSPESDDEKRENANVSERKKVTFDLNVKIYEHLPDEEDEDALVNGDSVEINGGIRNAESNKEETVSDSNSNSSSSSLFSYPLNHRYQNCTHNDDELDEVLSSDGSDIEYYTDEDEDGDEDDVVESSRTDIEETKDSTQNASKSSQNPYDRSKYVNSVLNPVENVAQWKVVKAKSKQMTPKDEDRESKENFEKNGIEIRVDTSLSSWLKAGSEATSNTSKTSSVSVTPKKYDDRPILGALTLEEIRQFSAPSSPRKSPGFSPDDKPIIGSVGSYWSHTGESTKSESSIKSKSRFGENAKVIWDATPFETRLEKALEDSRV